MNEAMYGDWMQSSYIIVITESAIFVLRLSSRWDFSPTFNH